MEQYQIFSVQFDQNSVSLLSGITDEVNNFIRKTPQVNKVEWHQTPVGSSSVQLTAVITYTVIRQAGSLMD